MLRRCIQVKANMPVLRKALVDPSTSRSPKVPLTSPSMSGSTSIHHHKHQSAAIAFWPAGRQTHKENRQWTPREAERAFWHIAVKDKQ
eukprot:scaffold117982_cov18-Tisochrysis_lutea.AAC.1